MTATQKQQAPPPDAPPQNAAALARRAAVDTVRHTLEILKPQLQMALPAHLTPDRLCRVVVTQIQRTPKLLECDRTSLLEAVMTAAQLGLEPDGVLGHGYLVPFKRRVVFIPGYKGLIALARNSGEVSSIQAQPVYANDTFDFEYGSDEHLIHKPPVDPRADRGELVAFYAYARMKGGGFHFEVMTLAEVHRVRDASSGYRTAMDYAKRDNREPETPWITHEVEMGRKTVIRRIAKYLPLAVQKAAALEDLLDAGKPANLGDAGELLIPEDVVDVEASEVEATDASKSRMDRIADEAAGKSTNEADPAPKA